MHMCQKKIEISITPKTHQPLDKTQAKRFSIHCKHCCIANSSCCIPKTHQTKTLQRPLQKTHQLQALAKIASKTHQPKSLCFASKRQRISPCNSKRQRSPCNSIRMNLRCVVHHGGILDKSKKSWSYDGGTQHVEDIPDIDRWSYFEAVGIVKELGYKGGYVLWWNFEGGFKEFRWDKDAAEAAKIAMRNNSELHLYVDVVVELDDLTVSGSDESDSDYVGCNSIEETDSEGGLLFEDSEEDKALGKDDDFPGEDSMEVNATIEVVGHKNKLRTRTDNANDVDINDSRFNHEMGDEYESEELYSDEGSSDEEIKPRYPVFRKEMLDKRYKFKVGLEFRSLEEFKEALMEHSVLNGREIRWVKCDKSRARAECKQRIFPTSL